MQNFTNDHHEQKDGTQQVSTRTVVTMAWIFVSIGHFYVCASPAWLRFTWWLTCFLTAFITLKLKLFPKAYRRILPHTTKTTYWQPSWYIYNCAVPSGRAETKRWSDSWHLNCRNYWITQTFGPKWPHDASVSHIVANIAHVWANLGPFGVFSPQITRWSPLFRVISFAARLIVL